MRSSKFWNTLGTPNIQLTSKMSDKGNNLEIKLASGNHSEWRVKMYSLLVLKEIQDVLDEEIMQDPAKLAPVPANDVEATRVRQEQIRQYQAWNKRSIKVRALIELNVNKHNSERIRKLQHGRSAWEALGAYHNNQTVGNLQRLQERIANFKIRPGDSMEKHLDQLFEMFMRYREAGAEYSDSQMVQQMLTSIRPVYANVVDSISAQKSIQDPWSLRMWLIDYGQSIEDSSESKAAAFAVARKRDIDSSSEEEEVPASKPRLKSEVHKVEQKASLTSYPSTPSSSASHANYICNGCKQRGHIRAQCNAVTMTVNQIERLLKMKKSSNKANAAGSGQNYTNCITVSNVLSDWIIDSGATTHMTPSKKFFTNYDRSHRSQVLVADGKSLRVIGRGEVKLNLITNKGVKVFTLKNVLHVPGLKSNLFSIRQFTASGEAVVFDANKVYLLCDQEKALIGHMSNNHYTLYGSEQAMLADQSPCKHEWHRRLAHRNLGDVSHMISLGLPSSFCQCSDICEECLKGKMARRPFKAAASVKNVLDVIVSDVHGPMPVESIGKKRYFVTFIDAKSRYCEVRFIRQKSEVTACAVQYIEHLKTKFGKKPKVFRSDRGTEYMDHRLQDYLLEEGIWFETTVGYCPQQNGISERMNRTLGEAALTLLCDSQLPRNHWAEAVASAAYSLNRVISKGSNRSPVQMFCGDKPDWDKLRQFGSEVYVHVPEKKRDKLQPKAIKMKFVGFDPHAKGYRVSDGNKIILSREVKFIDGGSKLKRTHQKSSAVLNRVETDVQEVPESSRNDLSFFGSETEEQDYEENHSESDESEVSISTADFSDSFGDLSDQEEEPEPVEAIQEVPRRSNRVTAGRLPRHFADFEMGDDYADDYALLVNDDPKSYKEAMRSTDAPRWKAAIQEELNSIKANRTWTVTSLPPTRKAVGSKWVFRTKKSSDGQTQYKARLVAQGFTQKYGVDYDEVFAPVANNTTMKVLLSVAGQKGFLVKHYDVKSAFLNGNLQEEIYMKPPPGVNENGKVYRLNKSLYGLKQAAHVWNKTLNESLLNLGCKQCNEDECLFIFSSNGDKVYLLVHVDDILAATNSLKALEKLMSAVNKSFEIKDLGEARNYLGISLSRNKEGFFELCQCNYIEKILDITGLSEAKESRIPMDTGYHKLNGKQLESNHEYRKIVGMLLYLSVNSRPDIAAAVGILCQKVSSPRDVDLNEAKRVLRYLKRTKGIKLTLGPSTLKFKSIEAFTDSDWAEDRVDRKSSSGILCLVNSAAVIWRSKKQSIVATSSAEAEYVALSQTVKELVWLRRLCESFDIKHNGPIIVNCDSQSAIAMVTKPKLGGRTKHIDVKYHHVKDAVSTGVIELHYIRSEDNIADVLTKPLGKNKMKQFRELLGFTSNSQIEEEC